MTITQLDRTNIKLLRAELDAAVYDVAQKYGISLKFGNASFTPNSATIKLNVAIKTADGTVVNREREDFTKYAEMYDLKPEWLDKTFVNGGKTFKITGLAMKRRKNPVMATCVSTGKGYIFPTFTIQQALGGRKQTPIVSDFKLPSTTAEIEAKIAEMRRDNPEMYYADGEYRASGMTDKQIHDHHFAQISRQMRGEGLFPPMSLHKV